FHLAFRKPIVSLMWVVLTTALILVFFVPSTLILSGLILFVFCVIYFLFQKQLAFWGLKEACIALMYTSGILLVPTVYTRIFDVTSFLLLFVLASLNLIIFSWMEMESDQRDGFDSIATRFGKLFTEKLILSVLAIGLTLSISSLQTDLYLSIYFMVSFSLYGVIVWVPGWFRLKERYRVLGDGVFMLPLFFEFI
ncbi:MAG: UbiA family prenyltransferase, partial [Bacteroidota bacterium]